MRLDARQRVAAGEEAAARETGAPSLPRQRRARRGRESKEIDYPCVFDHGHRCACICASYFKPNWGEVAPNPTRE